LIYYSAFEKYVRTFLNYKERYVEYILDKLYCRILVPKVVSMELVNVTR